jgi:hypothetical protein
MARALRRSGFRAPKIRYRNRYIRAGRRGVSRAAQVAREEKHTIAAVGAAAVCGLAESRNIEIPHVDALGVAGTYGVAAYLAGRYMKSKTLSHVATGLLSVAAYKAAAAMEGGGTSGDFIEGEIPALEQEYADAEDDQTETLDDE